MNQSAEINGLKMKTEKIQKVKPAMIKAEGFYSFYPLQSAHVDRETNGWLQETEAERQGRLRQLKQAFIQGEVSTSVLHKGPHHGSISSPETPNSCSFQIDASTLL